MRVAKVARGLGNGIHLPSNLICNIEDVHKNLGDITKRSSSTIAASAAAHAATAAAEKRATTTLLSLRDIAFESTKISTRQYY